MPDQEGEGSFNEANLNDIETARMALRWAIGQIHSLQDVQSRLKGEIQEKNSQEQFLQGKVTDLESAVQKWELQSREWENARKELELRGYKELDQIQDREQQLHETIFQLNREVRDLRASQRNGQRWEAEAAALASRLVEITNKLAILQDEKVAVERLLQAERDTRKSEAEKLELRLGQAVRIEQERADVLVHQLRKSLEERELEWNTKLTAIEQEKERWRLKFEDLNRRLAEIEDEREKLNSSAAQWRRDSQRLNEIIATVEKERTDEVNLRKEFETRYRQEQAESQGLQQLLQDLQSERSQLLAKLQHEVETREQAVAEAERGLAEQRDAWDRQRVELEQQKDRAVQDGRAWQEKANRTTEQLAEMAFRQSVLEDQKNTLQRMLDEERKAHLEDLEKQKEQLSRDIADWKVREAALIEEERKKWTAQQAEFADRAIAFEQSAEEWRTRFTETQTALQNLREDFRRQETEIARLNLEETQLRQAAAESEAARAADRDAFEKQKAVLAQESDQWKRREMALFEEERRSWAKQQSELVDKSVAYEQGATSWRTRFEESHAAIRRLEEDILQRGLETDALRLQHQGALEKIGELERRRAQVSSEIEAERVKWAEEAEQRRNRDLAQFDEERQAWKAQEAELSRRAAESGQAGEAWRTQFAEAQSALNGLREEHRRRQVELEESLRKEQRLLDAVKALETERASRQDEFSAQKAELARALETEKARASESFEAERRGWKAQQQEWTDRLASVERGAEEWRQKHAIADAGLQSLQDARRRQDEELQRLRDEERKWGELASGLEKERGALLVELERQKTMSRTAADDSARASQAFEAERRKWLAEKAEIADRLAAFERAGQEWRAKYAEGQSALQNLQEEFRRVEVTLAQLRREEQIHLQRRAELEQERAKQWTELEDVRAKWETEKEARARESAAFEQDRKRWLVAEVELAEKVKGLDQVAAQWRDKQAEAESLLDGVRDEGRRREGEIGQLRRNELQLRQTIAELEREREAAAADMEGRKARLVKELEDRRAGDLEAQERDKRQFAADRAAQAEQVRVMEQVAEQWRAKHLEAQAALQAVRAECSRLESSAEERKRAEQALAARAEELERQAAERLGEIEVSRAAAREEREKWKAQETVLLADETKKWAFRETDYARRLEEWEKTAENWRAKFVDGQDALRKLRDEQQAQQADLLQLKRTEQRLLERLAELEKDRNREEALRADAQGRLKEAQTHTAAAAEQTKGLEAEKRALAERVERESRLREKLEAERAETISKQQKAQEREREQWDAQRGKLLDEKLRWEEQAKGAEERAAEAARRAAFAEEQKQALEAQQENERGAHLAQLEDAKARLARETDEWRKREAAIFEEERRVWKTLETGLAARAEKFETSAAEAKLAFDAAADERRKLEEQLRLRDAEATQLREGQSRLEQRALQIQTELDDRRLKFEERERLLRLRDDEAATYRRRAAELEQERAALLARIEKEAADREAAMGRTMAALDRQQATWAEERQQLEAARESAAGEARSLRGEASRLAERVADHEFQIKRLEEEKKTVAQGLESARQSYFSDLELQRGKIQSFGEQWKAREAEYNAWRAELEREKVRLDGERRELQERVAAADERLSGMREEFESRRRETEAQFEKEKSRLVQSARELDVRSREAHAEPAATPAEAAAGQTEFQDLIFGIAHQIRTPLTVIQNFAETSLEKPWVLGESRRALQALQRSVDTIKARIEVMAEFSKPWPLRKRLFDLTEMLGKIILLVDDKCRAQAVTVKTDWAAMPPVSADADQIRTALLHVLFNAIEAMPKGGELAISSAWNAKEGVVTIEVSDTGVGMDSDAVQEAMRPFFSTRPGAVGIGIPVAQKIFRSHGGDLELDSRPGKGTRAVCRFKV